MEDNKYDRVKKSKFNNQEYMKINEERESYH